MTQMTQIFLKRMEDGNLGRHFIGAPI